VEVTKPYFDAPLPRVFAHRGLAAGSPDRPEVPENSLLAFEQAIALGVMFIETDVHATSDGIAVISHDPDLSRLTGLPGKVSDFSLDELSKLELGSGQHFCSLTEALTRFPSARFNIDIKSPDAVGPTVDAIATAKAEGRVLVTSFSDARRRAAMRRLPGVATSSGAFLFAVALFSAKFGATAFVRRILRSVDAVQVPERALGMQITTSRVIARLHAAHVEVHIWTINDPATMNALLDLGVDGLVTDRADIAIEVIRARS
jgi:glycerophosphoryl diester phosphodiesterase